MADALGVALFLFVASLVQGFLGFGFGIVAMTGLTMSHDLLHASGVVNLGGLALTSAALVTLRAHVMWGTALRIVPGILVGVLLGVAALKSLDREIMVRALGATVIAISAWNLLAPSLKMRESALRDGIVGLLGGLLGGAFNTGGPPLIAHLYRRPESPEAIKATIQVLFLTIGAARAPVAASQGLMTGPIWRDSALAIPFILVGLLLGIQLGRRVHADHFRRISWIALGALGLALLFRS